MIAERTDHTGYRLCPQYVVLCLCVSNCTVPMYTSADGAGAKEVYHVGDGTERSHKSNKLDFWGHTSMGRVRITLNVFGVDIIVK